MPTSINQINILSIKYEFIEIFYYPLDTIGMEFKIVHIEECGDNDNPFYLDEKKDVFFMKNYKGVMLMTEEENGVPYGLMMIENVIRLMLRMEHVRDLWMSNMLKEEIAKELFLSLADRMERLVKNLIYFDKSIYMEFDKELRYAIEHEKNINKNSE